MPGQLPYLSLRWRWPEYRPLRPRHRPLRVRDPHHAFRHLHRPRHHQAPIRGRFLLHRLNLRHPALPRLRQLRRLRRDSLAALALLLALRLQLFYPE